MFPFTSRALPLTAVALTAFLLPLKAANATDLPFVGDFDSAAGWTVSKSAVLNDADTGATFGFDYSTLGIAPSPHGGGNTTGLRLVSSVTSATTTGISVAPTGGSFTGTFIVKFDAYMNYVGPFPGGGTGSTQAISFGYGSTGSTVQWSTTNQGVMFAATGDGGSATDYRTYTGGINRAVGATGVTYAAGSQNNSAAYYTTRFPGHAVPDQEALYPSQSGTSAAGAFGMAWRDVEIEKTDTAMTWKVDGNLISTVDLLTSGATFPGSDISFGMFDTTNGATGATLGGLNTAIFDNLSVTATPEPETWAMMAMGCIALAALGFKRKKNENEASEL